MHKYLPFSPTQSGFTLIEMLVAVSIGLLLSGIGIVGYLDFNARQKIIATAKELETIFQTAQTRARSGDLGGCVELSAYQVTFNLSVDPIIASVTPRCQDGMAGVVKVFTLVPGVNMTTLPVITDLRFPALNGGVIFNPSAAQTEFILATSSITQTYHFILARAGDMSEGTWQ